MNLILRELTASDEAAFLQGYEDWKNEDLTWYSFVWKPGMTHAEHLKILEEQKDKTKLPSNRVPSTMLYAFADGKIVGRFNIRHELNDNLFERGGNIGYSVSPKERNKGYATEMFKQGIKYCQHIGLNKVLITCADQNTPSWKIIEKFGGSLENRIFDFEEEEFVRRYWLDLNANTYDAAKVADKAVAYITRERNGQMQLLVFDHDPQFADAGTQVPCGTVELGEDPETTILREITEESGLVGLKNANKIDQYQFFGDYAKKFLRRHVYQLKATGNEPDKWTHVVRGKGDDEGLNFHYFWIDLKEAKGRLSGRFDDSVEILLSENRMKGYSHE